VRQDNEREASDGFDGSWVAHPDLVRVAREIFEQVALAGEFVEFFTLPAYELLDRGPTTP